MRTPLLPQTELSAWSRADDPRAYLAALLELPEVREAIYIASPGLAGAIDSWRAAPETPASYRVGHALAKYVARMTARPTPFGLFSGVSTGTIARETSLELAPRTQYERRSRLDNDYLFALVTELAQQPEVRAGLRYTPNTSLYRRGEAVRYVEAHLAGTARRYRLVSIDATPDLDRVLARCASGATLAELAELLVDDEITPADAEGFVAELVTASVIVPDLAVQITGPEPLDALLARAPHPILVDVRARLAALDAGGIGGPTSTYRELVAALAPLPGARDEAKLFQVDLVKPATATLSARVATRLAQCATTLATMHPAQDLFATFKRAFAERWDGQEVPLADVLDEEAGIGFEPYRGPGFEGAPLLEGLAFSPAPATRQVRWSTSEVYLLRRFAEAAGQTELVLDERDLAALAALTARELPDAFSILARVGTNDELLFDVGTGPSGAGILGRFCGAVPALDTLVREHHALEEAAVPGAIFAEIVHLDEGRVGNVICRPVLRGYELPYLGASGAPVDRQLRIDDLRVSVRGDRVVLTSARLGCEVIPRLTTAHNYRQRTLGVYRFLATLAAQRAGMARWSWGVLEAAPFLPRVRIDGVIVSRATWNFVAGELAAITSAVRAARKDPRGGEAVLAAVGDLRARRDLPRWLVVAAGDNELPIDLDNPLLAAAFADELCGKDRVTLSEMFPVPDATSVRGPEGGFAAEVVLLYTRTRDEAPALAPAAPVRVRRTFAPGSEWVYAKIYTGEATADRVLLDAVAPIVRASGAPWFFLRYADPDPHLRVRIRGDFATIVPALERALPGHRLVLDTYVREIERYGGDRGIELVEQVFWHDSEAVLALLEHADGAPDLRWKLAVRSVDGLLASLGLDADQRARVCLDGRDLLAREFNAAATVWAALGARFAQHRAELELDTVIPALARRDAALAPICRELQHRDQAGELAPSLADQTWSLTHMHVNRLMHASQRAQEMAIYELVRRLHAARRGRRGAQSRASVENRSAGSSSASRLPP
ncbi:MAG: lantibiotic dehydratase [Kofleriaceae bacterium]